MEDGAITSIEEDPLFRRIVKLQSDESLKEKFVKLKEPIIGLFIVIAFDRKQSLVELNLIQENIKEEFAIYVRLDQPWQQFIDYIEKFDQIFIRSSTNVIDENAFLVINPYYLISVTNIIDAMACPRKVYVRNKGAEGSPDINLRHRIIQGNLMHDVFGQKISHNTDVEEAIPAAIENNMLELIAYNFNDLHAHQYLTQNAQVFSGFNTPGGLTEIDCQSWEYGIQGKFDALVNNRILELKTNPIPDTTPWPRDNLQMSIYLKMIDNDDKYTGNVIYANDGQMGMKSPTGVTEAQMIIGRNLAYIVQSGRYTPLILRGELQAECERCFLKNGCQKLCEGQKTMRDCDDCYHNPYCDKLEWDNASVDYYEKMSDNLLAEERETVVKINDEAKARLMDGSENVNLVDQGFAIQLEKKIDSKFNRGNFTTKFKINSDNQIIKSRFRRGELIRIYDLSHDHHNNSLFFSARLLHYSPSAIEVESINSLPDTGILVSSNSTLNYKSGRKALYLANQTDNQLLEVIKSETDHLATKKQAIQDNNTRLNHSTLLENYNDQQIKAISKATSTEDFYMIQGPAGTGKTTVILEIINQLLQAGKKVIVSAFTNTAVDNIALKLNSFKIDYIRLGNNHSMNELVVPYGITQKFEQYKKSKSTDMGFVYLSTTSTIANNQFEDLNVDFAILDEAAQMNEVESLKPILHSSKVILVGDHKQLPPIILSDFAKRQKFDVSLFERLFSRFPQRTIMLLEQYRMADEILKFPNLLFYNNELKSASQEIAKQSLGEFQADFIDSSPYQVVSIHNQKQNPNSNLNLSEAATVFEILKELIENVPELVEEDIGVITPFRAQASLLSRFLPHLQVDTIDRFQGSERKIVILSTVSGLSIPILNDPRRINVALTRARFKLVVILSNVNSDSNSLQSKLLQDSEHRNVVTRISSTQISEILSSQRIHQNISRIYKNFKWQEEIPDPPSFVLAELGVDAEWAIYFGTQSLSIVTKNSICTICRKEITEGIQCPVDRYLFHKDELVKWLKIHNSCPICKITLIPVQVS